MVHNPPHFREVVFLRAALFFRAVGFVFGLTLVRSAFLTTRTAFFFNSVRGLEAGLALRTVFLISFAVALGLVAFGSAFFAVAFAFS